MIVVDLDYTIWPMHCFEKTLGPYISLSIDEIYQPDKILCVDRKTKLPRIMELYSDVRDILLWAQEQGIRLSVCSRILSYDIARDILEKFGLWDLFEFPQIYDARKSHHFRNLVGCTGLAYSDMLFFDDEIKNIEITKNMGIVSCLVDKSIGLDVNIFLNALTDYADLKLSAFATSTDDSIDASSSCSSRIVNAIQVF